MTRLHRHANSRRGPTCQRLGPAPFKAGSSVYVCALCLLLWWSVCGTSTAAVRVFIQNSNNLAVVAYECTGGETIRAFALDVSVDQGTILAISDFARGPSTATAPGYGIFPASLRDHLQPISGSSMDWSLSSYTPLAVPSDAPGDTLPGLGSSGVTLEFGALWDPTNAAALPSASGTLCTLTISLPAHVSVKANAARGGVVGAFAGTLPSLTFTGAPVGPMISTISFENGTITVIFSGGELQTASSPDGPWEDTDDSSGTHTEAFTANEPRFFRVRGP